MHRLDQILLLFSEMNITLVKEIAFVGDDRFVEYKEEKLLNELMQVFLPLKRQGDRFLTIHDTKCSIESCDRVEGKNFYCFVGNKSNDYCLVNFKTKGDQVIGIDFCSELERPKGIELNNLIQPKPKEYPEGMPF